MATGRIIAEFPDVQWTTVEARLNDYSTATIDIPWENAPINWHEASEPAKTVFLLLSGDLPLWGGWVQERTRNLGDASFTLSLVTWEGYLERQFVPDMHFWGTGQTRIAAMLVLEKENERNPIRVKSFESAYKRDRIYSDIDDKTVLSALQDLSNITNGVDWTITWKNDGGGYFYPLLTVADTLGSLQPVTTFNVESLASFSVNDSYTSENGANKVRATSSAEGDVRPQSWWLYGTDTSMPLFERSFTPSSSITNVSTLTAHAQNELETVKDGAHFLSFVFDFLTAPVLGVEWGIGDVIAWRIPEIKEQFPEFWAGQARCIGYSISFGSGAPTITPVLFGEGDMQL